MYQRRAAVFFARISSFSERKLRREEKEKARRGERERKREGDRREEKKGDKKKKRNEQQIDLLFLNKSSQRRDDQVRLMKLGGPESKKKINKKRNKRKRSEQAS